MTVLDFDQWVKNLLPLNQYPNDMSLNGLQVGKVDNTINHMAFALDACEASINQAIHLKADTLVVHHGLFWGKPIAVTNSHYNRIKLLLDNNMALYAIHLPLDAVEEFGNNYTVAQLCGLPLPTLVRFEEIGFAGQLPQDTNVFDLAHKLFPHTNPLIWPFCPKVNRVAIVVGGAARYAYKAIEQGYNCFITGEITHELYHYCQENGLSVIAGGHYQSEMLGLKAFANYIEQLNFNIKVSLIDLPTGV